MSGGLVTSQPARREATLRDVRSDTWAATDALGRALPGPGDCPPPRADRFVGIFYFIWQGSDPSHVNRHGQHVYDISKLLAENADNPAYGPFGSFHWWGEPHLGYYLSEDEYVLRKHALQLVEAGVDFIFVDVTNAETYDGAVAALLRVYRALRDAGEPTPRICFCANVDHVTIVEHLHRMWYASGEYDDLWFEWDGRPVMLAPDTGHSGAVAAAFTFRQSWAWRNDPSGQGGGWFGDGRHRWAFMDHHPQAYGWADDPAVPEQISVSVAQHPVHLIGRSFHDGHQPLPDRLGACPTSAQGLCFAEQLQRALEVDPQVMMITGWNEWVAGRWHQGDDPPPRWPNRPYALNGSLFVDAFSQEWSRDIEPMRGGHTDSYYHQMVAGIRRFKGVRTPEPPSPPQSIDVAAGFEQWRDVTPEFLDSIGDVVPRDHPAWEPPGRYVDDSARNNLELMKVARDDTMVSFYVRTTAPITPAEGNSWMVLLLDTDGDPATGWEGFNVAVNRQRRGDGVTVVERNVGGGWCWEPIVDAPYRVEGNQLHLSVPRTALGLHDGDTSFSLQLKWLDNVPESGDITDFIDRGDVAPSGRFRYVYSTEAAPH